MFNRKWSSRVAALLGVFMVATLLLSAAPASAQTRTYANIGLRARVNPNITAAVGEPLTYQVAAVNFGPTSAYNIEVGLPLDLGNLALTNATFTDRSGFVTAVITDPSINLLVAHFADRLDAGQVVTGTFTFIPQAIANGLTMRGTTSNASIAYAIGIFEDESNGGVTISNRVQFDVTDSSQGDGTWDQIQTCETNPSQKNAANGVDVRCRNFAPGERIHFWINFPGGVIGDNSIDYVDETGLYGFNNFDVTKQDLPAGNYSIVFHGDYSGVDMVFPFTVK